MKCGECKYWIKKDDGSNYGRCIKVELHTWSGHEICTISEKKEPEKPSPKDGDFFYLDNGFYCHFYDNTGPSIVAVKQHGAITSDRKFLFNLFELGRCVRDGGVVVGLNHDLYMDIITHLANYCPALEKRFRQALKELK